MNVNAKEVTPILCQCGNKLFDLQPGRFGYHGGTIECAHCRHVSQMLDLVSWASVQKDKAQ